MLLAAVARQVHRHHVVGEALEIERDPHPIGGRRAEIGIKLHAFFPRLDCEARNLSKPGRDGDIAAPRRTCPGGALTSRSAGANCARAGEPGVAPASTVGSAGYSQGLSPVFASVRPVFRRVGPPTFFPPGCSNSAQIAGFSGRRPVRKPCSAHRPQPGFWSSNFADRLARLPSTSWWRSASRIPTGGTPINSRNSGRASRSSAAGLPSWRWAAGVIRSTDAPRSQAQGPATSLTETTSCRRWRRGRDTWSRGRRRRWEWRR